MNDVEQRLRSALREAVPEPGVSPGLVRAAARQAVRVRRRRAAARSAVGATALVTGGSVLVRGVERPPASWVEPSASAAGGASPAASAPASVAEPGVRFRVLDCTVTPSMSRADGSCRRGVLEITITDGRVQQFEVAETVLVGTGSWPAPTMLVVDSGGTEQSVPARQESENTWVFDVALPPGKVARVSIETDSPGRTLYIRLAD